MELTARLLAALAALPMLANGLGWLLQPAQTAQSLGMPLLDGLGRSTQIGDFFSFFLVAALLGLYGAGRRHAGACFAAALLVGLAAVGRLLASGLHDAPLATFFIAVEVVLALVWSGAGLVLRRGAVRIR